MSEPLSGLRELVAELKRRRVFRVVFVYAAVGFVLLQVAALLLPALLLPDWSFRLLVAFLILGFPVALVLAWAFELTPDGGVRWTKHGDKAAQPGPAAAARKRSASQLAAVGVPLALALGGGAFLLSSGFFARSASPEAEVDRSIAVLPFANLAGPDDADPFVDGIHGDILSNLAGIRDLHSISRTSVLGYRNTTKRISEIAAELGVANVLEGGIQRAGNRVRVNVQLIEAATDRQLWAERYDRELTVGNVFQIQAEIAARIAGALRATLAPDEERRIREVPTSDLVAYDHYLRGDAHRRSDRGLESTLAARDEFERAVERDPGFGIAWARLAGVENFLAWAHNLPEHRERASQALERAVALAPNAPETLSVQAYFHYHGPRDYERALRFVDELMRVQPNDAESHAPRAFIYRRQARFEEAAAVFEQALTLDPRSYTIYLDLANTYWMIRRFEDAERMTSRALALAPDRARAYWSRLELLLAATGDTAAARRQVDELPGTLASEERRHMAAAVAYYRRDFGGVRELHPRRSASDYNRLALAELRAGEVELAAANADSALALAFIALEEAEQRVGAASVNALNRNHRWAAVALAILGEDGKARDHLERAVRLVPLEHDAVFATHTRAARATVYALGGDTAAALDELEALLTEPTGWTPALLRIDPVWDPLRDHPRFRRLVGPRQAGV